MCFLSPLLISISSLCHTLSPRLYVSPPMTTHSLLNSPKIKKSYQTTTKTLLEVVEKYETMEDQTLFLKTVTPKMSSDFWTDLYLNINVKGLLSCYIFRLSLLLSCRSKSPIAYCTFPFECHHGFAKLKFFSKLSSFSFPTAACPHLLFLISKLVTLIFPVIQTQTLSFSHTQHTLIFPSDTNSLQSISYFPYLLTLS